VDKVMRERGGMGGVLGLSGTMTWLCTVGGAGERPRHNL
jgi:hypothetical protein